MRRYRKPELIGIDETWKLPPLPASSPATAPTPSTTQRNEQDEEESSSAHYYESPLEDSDIMMELDHSFVRETITLPFSPLADDASSQTLKQQTNPGTNQHHQQYAHDKPDFQRVIPTPRPSSLGGLPPQSDPRLPSSDDLMQEYLDNTINDNDSFGGFPRPTGFRGGLVDTPLAVPDDVTSQTLPPPEDMPLDPYHHQPTVRQNQCFQQVVPSRSTFSGSLPQGLPPGLSTFEPPDIHFQHHHRTTPRPFSAVIEPPKHTDRLWLDDDSIIYPQPSLAASSVSAASVFAAAPAPPQVKSKPQPKTSPINPKSDLHTYYGKQKTSKSISATNYHTWHDGGPAHELRWTSVLCCPNHGVLYHSIPFKGCVEESPIMAHDSYWFTKKITAEHAAAAHSYDYQTGTNTMAAIDPLPAPQWEVPRTAPPALKATIELQQNKFRIANGLQPLVRR